MRKILYLFAVLLLSTTAKSQALQQFSVASFEEKPFDTAARDPRYELRDGNNDLFSIFKITSDAKDDDLRAYDFDFDYCEDRFLKFEDGELWLYVQRNAMHVAIKRPGYSTVKHELNMTVQSGRVYEMKLSLAPRVITPR